MNKEQRLLKILVKVQDGKKPYMVAYQEVVDVFLKGYRKDFPSQGNPSARFPLIDKVKFFIEKVKVLIKV